MLHQVGYDDGGPDAVDPAPRVDQRDGRALRRSRRGAGVEERVRRRRVGPRAHDPVARPSAATASARSATSTPRWPTSRATRGSCPNAICMHEEDVGIGWKHVDLLDRPPRGAAQPPAGDQPHRHRRQLRVRLLLVPLPRRQHPARGQAHRHHVAAGRSTRATTPAYATTVAAGRRRAGAPAPVLRPPRLRRRRRREPRRGGRGRGRCRRRRTTRGPTASASGPTAARAGSPRRSARRTAATSRRVAGRPTRTVRNGLGAPVGYKLRADDVDADAAGPARVVGRPAGRLRPPQPVGHAVRSRRAAGRGRLPEPARRRRRAARVDRRPTATSSIADVVLWYTFGVTHIARPEDWPVMPVEYTGFLLHAVRLLRPQPGPRRRPRRPPTTAPTKA